jgi:hypothetical protein
VVICAVDVVVVVVLSPRWGQQVFAYLSAAANAAKDGPPPCLAAPATLPPPEPSSPPPSPGSGARTRAGSKASLSPPETAAAPAAIASFADQHISLLPPPPPLPLPPPPLPLLGTDPLALGRLAWAYTSGGGSGSGWLSALKLSEDGLMAWVRSHCTAVGSKGAAANSRHCPLLRPERDDDFFGIFVFTAARRFLFYLDASPRRRQVREFFSRALARSLSLIAHLSLSLSLCVFIFVTADHTVGLYGRVVFACFPQKQPLPLRVPA